MQVDVIGNVDEVRKMDIAGRSVVVIDVLRTTSTIVTALAFNAAAVVAVETVPMAKQLDLKDCIRGGERFGKKLAGFETGNSPYEYMTEDIAGKTVVLTTTDGTRALIKAVGAKHVLAGAFLNVNAVASALGSLRKDVLLLCAGHQGEFALEDGLCAGMIIGAMKDQTPCALRLNDLGMVLYQASLQCEGKLFELIRASAGAKSLERQGRLPDISYCVQTNLLDCVPEMDASHPLQLFRKMGREQATNLS